MKCTLRKASQGVVATIDERPQIGQKYYNIEYETILTFVTSDLDSYLIDDYCHTIIASTFGVGKEIDIFYNTYSKNTKEEVLNSIIGYEYPYTETETQIIIQL